MGESEWVSERERVGKLNEWMGKLGIKLWAGGGGGTRAWDGRGMSNLIKRLHNESP